MRAAAAALLMVSLAVAVLPACQHEARTGGEMPQAEDPARQPGQPGGEPLRDIDAVMADHVDRLMATDGVTGVAIGETPEGAPCIMILVRELTDEVRRALPERIEGHPTCLFESGEIRPM